MIASPAQFDWRAPAVQEYLAESPEANAKKLTAALAQLHDTVPASILVGPGSAALLHGLIARWASHSPIIASSPSFSLYAEVSHFYGAEFRAVPLDGYAHDLARLKAAAGTRPAVVILDSPHSVTGSVLSVGAIKSFAASLPKGSLLVCDNVYADYSEVPPLCIEDLDVSAPVDILSVRSLSKAWLLFGLRVGFMLGRPHALQRWAPLVLKYDIGSLSQAGAVRRISDASHLERQVAVVRNNRQSARRLLDAHGLGYGPAQGDSILIDVGGQVERIAAYFWEREWDVRSEAQHGFVGHLQVPLARSFDHPLLAEGLSSQ